MRVQRRRMGCQESGNIGIQGVVGEIVLGRRGQHRYLGIEHCPIQRADALAEAGRPPSPEPMTQCQPPQRIRRPGQHRHRRQLDDFPRGGIPQCLHDRDMPGLAEDPPHPVRPHRIGETHDRRLRGVVDRPRQHRAAHLQHRHQRNRCRGGAGCPQTGFVDESHSDTCNSSITLIRCR